MLYLIEDDLESALHKPIFSTKNWAKMVEIFDPFIEQFSEIYQRNIIPEYDLLVNQYDTADILFRATLVKQNSWKIN